MKASKILLTGLALGSIMSASADDIGMTTVWTVDYSGKPPFKRKLETLPVAELNRFETGKVTEVRTVDFRGKPPYARNRQVVDVVDLARFEVVQEERFVPLPRRMKSTHYR